MTEGLNQNAPTSYRSFAEIGDENHILIHVSPTSRDTVMPWTQYMHDLDDFFIRLYKYHQKSGFACLLCGQLLELLQIIYSVFLPVYFLNYIDYDILFRNKAPPASPDNPTAKVHIYDVIKPYDQVSIPPIQLFAIFLAFIFLIWKTVKTVYSVIVNLAIRQFYKNVLHINDCSSLTWQDVQTRIISSKQNFLAQDSHLNELDVHNRILRHNNYMIALVNRGVLPIYFRVPLIGETTFFTQSFLYNCQLLFFRGPFKCIFDENWLISDDVKNASYRQVVAKKLNRNILILAVINLMLCPLLVVWQILYFFYSNAALVKRDPVVLGLRNWSLYARWFCRHFNELDHQLHDRLNHAYKPAKNYMDAFTSPIMEILARHVRFVAGSTFAILLLLTVYDEDVIQVVHLLTVVTALWLIWSSAGGFIPPEIPMRFTKVELYEQILQHIHYVPHHYPPFTPQARASMSNLFQYKIVKLFEDLLSTVATPYILVRHLRRRSLEIVDFFRNFTVEIVGIGDVCTFSLMNVKDNGNPAWTQPMISSLNKSIEREFDIDQEGDNKFEQPGANIGHTSADDAMEPHTSTNNDYLLSIGARTRQPEYAGSYHDGGPVSGNADSMQQLERETLTNHAMPMQTEHGKLELSLIHFKLHNPSWNPSSESQREFINKVTSQALEQASSRQMSHLSQNVDEMQGRQQTHHAGSSVLHRSGSPSVSHGIESSSAVGLSTLFLHEHARMPMSTSQFTGSASSTSEAVKRRANKSNTETDRLL